MVITVKRAWFDPGNCREYFKVVSIENDEGRIKEPKGILICSQEESEDSFSWYRVCNDGCWYEPEGLIKSAADIVLVTDTGNLNVLRSGSENINGYRNR